MRLPDSFIKAGGGFFFYRNSPIYVRRFGFGPRTNYVVGSKGSVPHFTAIPGTGEEAMLEAVALAKRYYKEQQKGRRCKRA